MLPKDNLLQIHLILLFSVQSALPVSRLEMKLVFSEFKSRNLFLSNKPIGFGPYTGTMVKESLLTCFFTSLFEIKNIRYLIPEKIVLMCMANGENEINCILSISSVICVK